MQPSHSLPTGNAPSLLHHTEPGLTTPPTAPPGEADPGTGGPSDGADAAAGWEAAWIDLGGEG